VLGEHLRPLLEIIGATFVPLMRSNEEAYRRHVAAGATLFNEKAFDAGVSLYDGEMLGHPFRSVVKTFQVRVWRELMAQWDALAEQGRARVEAVGGPPLQ